MAAASNEYVLQERDIHLLLNILAVTSHKWEELGTALGLPKNVREQSRQDRNNILSLSNILREWLSGNGVRPTTLGNLKQKLGTAMVGEGVLAQQLIQRFNKAAGGTDQSAASQEPPNGKTKDLLDSKLLYSRLECGIVILLQTGITFILKVEEKCWHTHFMLLLLLFFSWFV